MIRISDNGPGIAAKDLPRVFNRFDRVVEEGVRGEAALGLGLPLTRQFIEAHGGTVELESKKGKGTTVTLTIPRGTEMILADEAATRGARGARWRAARGPGDVITLVRAARRRQDRARARVHRRARPRRRSAEPELRDRPAL